MGKKAVCLLSGGLDSAVATYIAHDQGYLLFPLTFSYDQQHTKEVNCAKKIATSLQIQHHIIFPLKLAKISNSALLSKSPIHMKNHVYSSIGKTIPATYVPARNTIFLSLALAYAESIQASAIFLGVNAVDYSGYPDCRPEYIKAFQTMANLATKQGLMGQTITIKTPLLHLTKTQIIKKGVTLGVPFADTWSCYRGRTKACGHCDSCQLRLKGFKNAKTEDPLSYSLYPSWYKKKK